MGSRLVARCALVSIALVGMVSACADDTGGETTPIPQPATSSVVAEPSPTPSPTALATAVPLPVMPPEMANNDAAGAEAAARYFIDVYGYTYVARDLTPFVDMAHEDCVFCNSVVSEVEEMIADEERQAGGLVSVDAVTANEYHQEFDVFILDLETTQSSYVELDRSGQVIEESEGGSLRVSMIVQRKPDGWIVLEAGSDT